MRALISADMEGATGVTCPDDCRPGSPQWDRFRTFLTGDVNAVATGFFDAGVDEVIVTEAHASMRNILLEDLDPRVRMLTGKHKTYAMLEGIQAHPELVGFVGYHSGPSTPGILSHTFLGSELTAVTLNGRIMSEGYLNALLAAEYGAKLVLVSGDDLTCADARDYAPAARCVAVKEAVDRHTALCLTPTATAALLGDAARSAVAGAEVGPLPAPPYACEVEFLATNSAAAAALVPCVEQSGARTVGFTFDTVAELYRCFTVVTRIGKAAAEPVYG
ncbi:MAG TPA: M55 family metallopeptidase [Mycobacteriales bacterium]|jgi:D-amino peptidase|nr:M55 family metallopeptidase [Mycobacteriales bacterium]